MTMTLIVPKTQLKGEATAQQLLKQAKPIEVTCGAVTRASGQGIGLAEIEHSGFLIYRDAGGGLEVWDEGDKRWKVAVTTSPFTLKPNPLIRQDDGSWKGMLVAIGKKDVNNAEMFQPVTDTVGPQYMVTCVFKARDPSDEGLSLMSDPFRLAGLTSANRVGVASDPTEPENAKQIEVFAKNASLSTRAKMTLYSEDITLRVEVRAQTSLGTARIIIRTDGVIVLEPAGGQQVLVAGDLEVDRLLFRPNAGGPNAPKQYL